VRNILYVIAGHGRATLETGIVRLANWCGPQRGWEGTTFACPTNVGTLVTKKKSEKHLRGSIETTEISRAPSGGAEMISKKGSTAAARQQEVYRM